jgi:hypothetical protein
MSTFKEVTTDILSILTEIASTEFLDELGKQVVDMVRKRTQLGYGSKDSIKVKLDALSKPYVASRKRMGKGKTLSGMTSPSKSNLTLTGDMLADMTFNSKTGELQIDFKSDFSKKKAIYNTDGHGNCPPRPFLDLTEQEIKRVTVIIQAKAIELIKSKF